MRCYVCEEDRDGGYLLQRIIDGEVKWTRFFCTGCWLEWLEQIKTSKQKKEVESGGL